MYRAQNFWLILISRVTTLHNQYIRLTICFSIYVKHDEDWPEYTATFKRVIEGKSGCFSSFIVKSLFYFSICV